MIRATDIFNSADAPTLGANWLRLKGETNDLGIFSNQADVGTAAADCGNAYDGAINWPNDQYAQVKFAALGSSETLLWVRGEAVTGITKNGYQGGTDFGNEGNQFTVILKRVASAWTELANLGSAGIAAGDTVYLEVKGSAPGTIKLFVNGIEKLSVTDSSISSGKPGLSAIHSAGDVALFDDFEAGDFITEDDVVSVVSRASVPPNVRIAGA